MRIAVFCGSSPGHDKAYVESARTLGRYLAERNIELVFGGGKVGLMGAVADAVLDAGGEVFGVIPESLRDRELAHPGLTRLEVVASMHERKARMAELADAFVALPGGPGTLDELFEAWTWGQLGYHQKPCAVYNVEGYYDDLLAMIRKMCNRGFLKPEYADMLLVKQSPEALLSALQGYQPPGRKWGAGD